MHTDELLWFHAFDRKDDYRAIARVLRDGPTPNPSSGTRTRSNEERLEIQPSRVYAYLGRTLELFGTNALALNHGGVGGEMSPFDTGGLVGAIEPVCKWDTPRQLAYLNDYTWGLGRPESLLRAYPTNAIEPLLTYVRAERPSVAGPHVIWAEREPANIWRENEDWRAWTWEVRSLDAFDVSHLVHWTCHPTAMGQIFDSLEELAHDEPGEDLWLTKLARSYFHGGTSRLVSHMQASILRNAAAA